MQTNNNIIGVLWRKKVFGAKLLTNFFIWMFEIKTNEKDKHMKKKKTLDRNFIFKRIMAN